MKVLNNISNEEVFESLLILLILFIIVVLIYLNCNLENFRSNANIDVPEPNDIYSKGINKRQHDSDAYIGGSIVKESLLKKLLDLF